MKKMAAAAGRPSDHQHDGIGPSVKQAVMLR